ncbi:carbon-monoxide dehydrogenase medium subunit [Pseudovibrio denitrificans]|uniref:Carbon-monoxide dehydrogenase medium subunit n=1 Tax=Pseudovibrio denitrificans TaxID=258256 RepID=A0A1I7CQ98_9HYPH|nr:xanthine dehydrogenase family protein subunit M [Pseudovibrio denitrificans]SFU01597.1 carbon-monoxide dehydrogenase medium subunit [Pseudovibrio denitrificans]
MYETKYHRASTVSDAAAMLKNADDGKLLSGGQTLIPTMKQRLAAPSDLIDLRHIDEIAGIMKQADGSIRIGAATCHADVAANEDVKAALPGLADLACTIGDPHVRHMGTIGGSIANNDPAADYPAALLALGATIETNKREFSAEDFFTGMFETALDEDEIVTAVVFPTASNTAYAKFPNPASRYAMAGVFVAKTSAGARVAVTGAGQDGVFRMQDMEKALDSNWSADAVAGMAPSADDMLSDIHGTAAYRANLVTVMAKRAVAASS